MAGVGAEWGVVGGQGEVLKGDGDDGLLIHHRVRVISLGSGPNYYTIFSYDLQSVNNQYIHHY